MGCSKTYIDKINLIPGDSVARILDNNITAFKVATSSADSLWTAAIVEDSIHLYWPTFRPFPDSIRPAISISPKARIEPASGSSVAFETGTSFVVTSETGHEKKYTLIVKSQQAKPWIHVLNSYDYHHGQYVPAFGNGDLWLPDTAQTKLFFVATDGSDKAYPLEVTGFTNKRGVQPSAIIPMNIPLGTYTFKAINGIHTIYNQNLDIRFKVIPNNPNITQINFVPTDLDPIKAGSTITFRGYGFMRINQAFLSTLTSDDNMNLVLPIVEQSPGKLVMKLPNNLAPGPYRSIHLKHNDNPERFLRSRINVVK